MLELPGPGRYGPNRKRERMKTKRERIEEPAPLAHAKLTVKTLPLAKLKPHPKNPRKHPPEGSDEWNSLKASLADHYFDPLVWNCRNGMLVSGHLRRKILESMRCKRADVVVLDLDEKQHVQIMLRANVNSGEWATDILSELLKGMDEADQVLAGFDGDMLASILEGETEPGNGENPYTGKIVAPVYVPKGERPPIADLIDRQKTEKLMAEIDASGVPKEVAQFLRFAAERHTVFNFRQIAEFYCHADTKVQDLMERSALVIIDFKKAIENGFVHLTERLGELADMEEADNADA